MNITKKLSAALLALSLALSSIGVYAAVVGTTPGYKLVNTYNEDEGIITSELYVTGGYGAVGQLGLYYDTDLLDLGATVGGALTAEYDITSLNISNFVSGIKGSGYEVVATAETNKVVNLVDEDNGEFFFAWYSGATANVDARSEDKKIAVIRFLVADGVTATDLEAAGTDLIMFATEKPHNTSVKGYSAGVMCENEKTTRFANSETAKNRITLAVEFVGLDIEQTEIVTITVLDKDGNPVEGAYVKIGSEEVQTDANGKAVFEVAGEDYVVYYKYSESDTYEALEFGETAVELTAPAQPTDLSVTRSTEKLTVSWTKPSTTGGSDIIKYIVSYTPAGGEESTQEVDGNTTRVVLEGLVGGTEYTIKVKAVNALGEGEYSESKTGTPKKEETGGGFGGGGAPEVTNYTVTYEVGANGTIISGSKTESVKTGEKPSKVPTIKVADGYEFIGWATKDGTAVDPTTVTIKAATTFYAQYKKLAPAVSFVDVQAGTYYEAPVQWAVNKGITTGTSATTFSPDSTCTRAQAVTFLWRAAGSPAPKNNEMVFTDVANSSYYYNAVLWAVENGITNGTSATTFSPDNNCTRAQIVTFLWRSQKTPAVDAANPFTDVASSQYYTNAVLWAVGNGITNGTSATTFSPDANCTRAQIVTFLYRCLADVK